MLSLLQWSEESYIMAFTVSTATAILFSETSTNVFLPVSTSNQTGIRSAILSTSTGSQSAASLLYVLAQDNGVCEMPMLAKIP